MLGFCLFPAEYDLLDMGCFVSKSQESGGNRKRPVNIGEVVVFVPGLRIPKPVDFSSAFSGQLSKAMIDRLTSLRSHIVAMSGKEGPTITRTRRKSSTQHGWQTAIFNPFFIHDELTDVGCLISYISQEGRHCLISCRRSKITCQYCWD